MRGIIVGQPGSIYEYEFIVVVPTDDGQYKWIGGYKSAYTAYEKAQEVNGAVIHNIRI